MSPELPSREFQDTELPRPALTRWQPLRAGLIDLFYYDTEEFWFHDGRLLLRGNNGTGKSKVLALSLPFLLDGDLSPHRVEPDADPKKKMEWNLLLGGAHPHPERLGYTWLEFGRVDEQGRAEFRTLGCGMKAVAGKGIARHWFFVTDQRVGDEVSLLDATGTALSKDRLTETIADRGATYDRARDYRRAVDEALFGFGEQRYGALVDLLVQLRQPQLSKRPSEKALSNALTESLPPLDQAVIADVAEAFRSLEEDRDSLKAMSEAHEAATSFLEHYRRYARIASRRRARQPREAQSTYQRINRDLGAANDEYAAAVEALDAAKARRDELVTARTRLQAKDEALRASPEMRSAHELERAAKDAQRLAGEATRLVSERDTARTRLVTRQERNSEAKTRHTNARESLTAARQSTTEHACAAHVEQAHTQQVDAVFDGKSDAQPEQRALRRVADQLVERQQRAIRHVSGLINGVDDADRALADARRKASELQTQSDELGQRREAADQLVTQRGAELVTAVRGHLDAATELRLADLAGTMAELELWVDTLEGANPAATAVNAAGHAANGELAKADAELRTRERSLQQRITEITEQVESLERGADTTPPVPHTRDDAARAERPGAPLWQLVDFADEVCNPDRAGIEAALEAAGILDAWVLPTGEVLNQDTDDVLVLPDPARSEEATAQGGNVQATSLATVLRPAIDTDDPRAGAVSEDTLAGILAAVDYGSIDGADGESGARTWVDRHGRFRVGVLEGRWSKPVAAYIGRSTREVARRARLAELRDELTTVEAQRGEVADARTLVRQRSETLAAEVANLPSDAGVRDAHAHVSSLVAERERLTERQADAADAATAAAEAAQNARAALEEAAADAGLPHQRAALDDVDTALGEYRVSLAGLWPAWNAVADADRQAREAATELEQAEAALTELARRAGEAEQEAASATEHHETLRSTVGAAVQELQRQLSEVAEAMRSNQDQQDEAGREVEQAIDARGNANGKREQLTSDLADATEQRAAATESFQRFTRTGLLAVALPELDIPDPDTAWAPDPTVRLARKVNDDLADVADDEQTWERAQKKVTEEFKTLAETLSRQGNRATAELLEDGVVVEVEFRGRRTTVPELADALRAEVTDRERLLDERERAILENHLVNEVASTLQELISAAEDQVARMNAELADRPTSTGMRLRIVWRPRPDGPTGLAAARERLLRQTADAWSEDDRAAVGAFLQEQIADVRAKDSAGTWLEQLSEALDYRTWHGFTIERHQNGQWRSATGPASGGERVLAASVPLFAAASSHYASAGNPNAPRLVTLDEAFAGVDDNARAKYLGLLAAFDLDVVMTSEREWGCYPEVPGLSIAQLSRTEGVDAVLVTNWKWDGNAATPQPRPVQAVREQNGAGQASTGQAAETQALAIEEGLWE